MTQLHRGMDTIRWPPHHQQHNTANKGGGQCRHVIPWIVLSWCVALVNGRPAVLQLGWLLLHISLGVLDWFWIYKLTGHVHCIGWRPLGTAQPIFSLASMSIPLTVPGPHTVPGSTPVESRQADLQRLLMMLIGTMCGTHCQVARLDAVQGGVSPDSSHL